MDLIDSGKFNSEKIRRLNKGTNPTTLIPSRLHKSADAGPIITPTQNNLEENRMEEGNRRRQSLKKLWF